MVIQILEEYDGVQGEEDVEYIERIPRRKT